MKKIFYIVVLFFLVGSASAQQNSICLEFPILNNGNTFPGIGISGIGVSYFKSITSKHALGIRPSIKFDNKESSSNDFSWQVDFLSKIKTSDNQKTKTHIEFGGSLLNRMDRAFHPSDGPTICFVGLDDVKTKYLGFVLGASIERRLGTHFNLGLSYRANLFYNLKENPEQTSFFTSNPIILISYNF